MYLKVQLINTPDTSAYTSIFEPFKVGLDKCDLSVCEHVSSPFQHFNDIKTKHMK